MAGIGTILTTIVTALVVIGVVIYFVNKIGPRVNDPNIIKLNKLSSTVILRWIDECMLTIKTKEGCSYSVNILPNSSSNELLTKPVKNAYAVLLLEKSGEKVSYLNQRVYIAKELSSELESLKYDKVVEIPIQL